MSEGTTHATMAASTLLGSTPCMSSSERRTHGVLVGGAAARALDAELVDEPFAVEEAVDDVRVADVDGEEHWRCGRQSLRRIAAPAHSSTRTARMTSPSATRAPVPLGAPDPRVLAVEVRGAREGHEELARAGVAPRERHADVERVEGDRARSRSAGGPRRRRSRRRRGRRAARRSPGRRGGR